MGRLVMAGTPIVLRLPADADISPGAIIGEITLPSDLRFEIGLIVSVMAHDGSTLGRCAVMSVDDGKVVLGAVIE